MGVRSPSHGGIKPFSPMNSNRGHKPDIVPGMSSRSISIRDEGMNPLAQSQAVLPSKQVVGSNTNKYKQSYVSPGLTPISPQSSLTHRNRPRSHRNAGAGAIVRQ